MELPLNSVADEARPTEFVKGRHSCGCEAEKDDYWKLAFCPNCGPVRCSEVVVESIDREAS